MPPANRHEPRRAKSSTSDYSVTEFLRDFPDDAACLEHLWRTRYAPDGEHAHCPRCDCERTFKRYATKQQRQSWTCTACGHHVHPTAGTIFHRSSTSLRLWFHAMYLMTSTRCGISAKQLERGPGVHHKTAWPMFNLRMVECGGHVRLRVIPSRRGPALSRTERADVNPASILFTDDWQAYKPLRPDYLDHRIINHSAGCYVEGDLYTNTIVGFFGDLKTGMRGAYKKASHKWLQSYLGEYAWRCDRRQPDGRSMFHLLLEEVAR